MSEIYQPRSTFLQIKELERENKRLRDLLSKVEKVHWFCPVCRRADWEVHKHEDDCPVKKELNND